MGSVTVESPGRELLRHLHFYQCKLILRATPISTHIQYVENRCYWFTDAQLSSSNVATRSYTEIGSVHGVGFTTLTIIMTQLIPSCTTHPGDKLLDKM